MAKSFDEPDLVRPARRPRNLPNGWDDLHNGSYKQKNCWKSKRNTKYKDIETTRYTLIIEDDDYHKVYNVSRNVRSHLEKLNYFFKVKDFYNPIKVVITYWGQHIGDWKNVKYLS